MLANSKTTMKSFFFTLYIWILSCNSMRIDTKKELQVIQLGDSSIQIKFNSSTNAQFYIILIKESYPGEYDQGVQRFRITPEDISNQIVVTNITVHLIHSTHYNIIVRAIKKLEKDNRLLQVGIYSGTFLANECESGIFCAELDSSQEQCMRMEWRCDGVHNCGDNIDEEDCQIMGRSSRITAEPELNLTKCMQQQLLAKKLQQTNPESDENSSVVPYCESDGSYAAMQCVVEENDSYTCNCVSRDGDQLSEPIMVDPFLYEDFCRILRGDDFNTDFDHDMY